MLDKADKDLIVQLICKEQSDMIVKDHTKYESVEYRKLEELKVKVKGLEG